MSLIPTEIQFLQTLFKATCNWENTKMSFCIINTQESGFNAISIPVVQTIGTICNAYQLESVDSLGLHTLHVPRRQGLVAFTSSSRQAKSPQHLIRTGTGLATYLALTRSSQQVKCRSKALGSLEIHQKINLSNLPRLASLIKNLI